MVTNEGIKGVLGGLFASISNGNQVSFREVADLPVMQKAYEAVRAGKPERFYYALVYPLSGLVDGLLQQELSGSEDAQFLFKHNRFVENHFRAIIDKFEGHACGADKSRTILAHLLHFQKTGKEISFDYTQQYTYHLPVKVFRTHEEIVGFFAALRHLYYGHSDAFVQVLGNIYASMDALERASPPEADRAQP